MEKPKWDLPIRSGAFIALDFEPPPSVSEEEYEPSVPTVQEPESEASQTGHGPNSAEEPAEQDPGVDPVDVRVSDAD